MSISGATAPTAPAESDLELDFDPFEWNSEADHQLRLLREPLRGMEKSAMEYFNLDLPAPFGAFSTPEDLALVAIVSGARIPPTLVCFVAIAPRAPLAESTTLDGGSHTFLGIGHRERRVCGEEHHPSLLGLPSSLRISS
jgi:hypothetical protein